MFPGASTMVIEIDPQPATSQEPTESKKRSLEALFQAAKSELQHIEGQGSEEGRSMSTVEITEVCSSTRSHFWK